MGTETANHSSRWPDFLLIGAAKAGSTALFKAVGRHPRVFSTLEKQPGFFSHPNKRPDFKGPAGEMHASRIVFDEEEYRCLFGKCPPGHMAFEASIYLSDASAPVVVAGHIPNAPLIAILRHPVDRAFSQYLHNRALGLEPCDSFEDAWATSDARQQAGWPPPYDYRNRGFYGAQLDLWMQHFPRKQILVLFYEDWISYPQVVLDRIWDHLGLERLTNPVVTKENVSSRQPRWAWLHYHMVSSRNPIRLFAQRVLPKALRDAVVSSVASVNLAKGPQLNPDLRRRLTHTYCHDIDHLEQIIGRDLGKWRI
jgi:hypothetical protein